MTLHLVREGTPPPVVDLMTQIIGVSLVDHIEQTIIGEGDEAHVHRLYGEYNEYDQRIRLDQSMGFERMRETFLHENLHAMFAAGQLDAILNGEHEELDEHVVSVLAPILLAWLRANPRAVNFLREVQS